MTERLLPWLRHQLAATLLDAPRYGLALCTPRLAGLLGRSWVDLRNRGERLLRRPDQRGVGFGWQWSSSLFYCQAWPQVGRRLLGRALADWPIQLRDAPDPAGGAGPLVSFIVGHRGLERLPLLLTTLRSIAGQTGCVMECVVVEQAVQPQLAGRLPAWVRYVYAPLPSPDLPYSRSWAFNVGARAAHGEVLIFHDNDLCVPAAYGRQALDLLAGRFEAARLQRFIFYLNPTDTEAVTRAGRLDPAFVPLEVVQNNHGGTLAVRRSTYHELGGHDEGFVGWGGEDNEMFDRLRTRALHEHAYLPFVHLYHPPQATRGTVHANSAYYEARMGIPAAERSAQLAQRPFGLLQGPYHFEGGKHGN